MSAADEQSAIYATMYTLYITSLKSPIDLPSSYVYIVKGVV